MFNSLVGERLGGPTAEAAASSSLAANLDFWPSDGPSSTTGPSPAPAPPDAEASRVCRALLDVHPSTDAPAATTAYTIKVEKLARSATTGVTASLNVNGRVVGRISGQAASKEAQAQSTAKRYPWQALHAQSSAGVKSRWRASRKSRRTRQRAVVVDLRARCAS